MNENGKCTYIKILFSFIYLDKWVEITDRDL